MTTSERPATTAGTRSHQGPAPWRPGVAVAGLVGVIAMGTGHRHRRTARRLRRVDRRCFNTPASPLNSLGQTFIQFTPEWLKEFAIRTFGENDKIALTAGMGITLLIVAVVIGIVGRVSPRIAVGITVVLILVTAGADLQPDRRRHPRPAADPAGRRGRHLLPGHGLPPAGRPGVTRPVDTAPADDRTPLIDPLTPTAAPAPGTIAENPKAGSSGRGPPDGPSATAASSRRRPAAVLQDRRHRCPGRRRRRRAGPVDSQHRRGGGQPQPASRCRRRPTCRRCPATSPSTSPGITPVRHRQRRLLPGRHRLRGAPGRPPTSGSCGSTALVDNEITLSYADLIAMPSIERMITLTCVSNEVGGDLAGNATLAGRPDRRRAEDGRPAGRRRLRALHQRRRLHRDDTAGGAHRRPGRPVRLRA